MESEAIVIYHAGNEILVYQIEVDSATLSLLIQCHNRYAGDADADADADVVTFITDFPTHYKENLVIDNTDYQSKCHTLVRSVSYVFLMGE